MVNQFLQRAGLIKKNGVSGVFSNVCFSPTPARSKKVFSYNIYYGNLLEFLKAKLEILWRPAYDQVPPRIFNSQACLHGALESINSSSGFLASTGSRGGFSVLNVSSSRKSPECMTSCVHLSISPVLTRQFFACPPRRLSYRSKRRCWFFSLFSFLVIVRIKELLPSS